MTNALLAAAAQDTAQAAAAASLQSRASKLANAQSPEKIRETAEKFEAFFIGQMMEYMAAGIKTDETFGGGHAEQTWRSLLNQEYGKEIAKTGRLGVSDMIGKEMLKMQEQRSKAAETATTEAAPEAAPEADMIAPPANHTAFVAAAGARRYAQAAAM
jgi:Rod binding domain-containing protein